MPERTVFQSMAQRHVISVQPRPPCYTAACVMTRANCGSVLVIDAGNNLLGIVTERDMITRVLAKALDPSSDPGQQVMTPQPELRGPRNQGGRRGAADD